MMKRTLSWTLMLILALGGLTLVGCDDDDTNGPAVQAEPSVFGLIMTEGMGPKALASQGSAIVSVNNPPAVPRVAINGFALGLEPELIYYSGAFGFMGEFEILDGGAAAVAIDLGTGGLAAAATVAVPGSLDWIAPASGDTTLVLGEPLTISWTPAENAESYWVVWSFEVQYLDDLGNSEYWYNQGTVFATGTELTIPAAEIWPPLADIVSLEYFWGDLDLMPVNGPMAPGDLPNVTGDATGFVIGAGYMADLDIDMAATPVKADDREQDLDPVRDLMDQMRR